MRPDGIILGVYGELPELNLSLITVYGSEFIDETERPKNEVMRAIENLS